jgi:hypothetical protein
MDRWRVNCFASVPMTDFEVMSMTPALQYVYYYVPSEKTTGSGACERCKGQGEANTW